MEWSNPRLVDLGMDSKASWFCLDGISPKFYCNGGAGDYDECWPGSSKPEPVMCTEGSYPF